MKLLQNYLVGLRKTFRESENQASIKDMPQTKKPPGVRFHDHSEVRKKILLGRLNRNKWNHEDGEEESIKAILIEFPVLRIHAFDGLDDFELHVFHLLSDGLDSPYVDT